MSLQLLFTLSAEDVMLSLNGEPVVLLTLLVLYNGENFQRVNLTIQLRSFAALCINISVIAGLHKECIKKTVIYA